MWYQHGKSCIKEKKLRQFCTYSGLTGYVDSLVTLKRMISTSTIHCRSKFRTMGWQFYTDIFQGVYIPAGKKLSSKRDFQKNSQENFFASLSQETTIYYQVFQNSRNTSSGCSQHHTWSRDQTPGTWQQDLETNLTVAQTVEYLHNFMIIELFYYSLTLNYPDESLHENTWWFLWYVGNFKSNIRPSFSHLKALKFRLKIQWAIWRIGVSFSTKLPRILMTCSI